MMHSTTRQPQGDLVAQALGVYGPACRYRLAGELPQVLDRRTAEACDEHVLAAHDYLWRCRSGPCGPRRAAAAYPLIARAEELQENEHLTSQLQIAVLGELERCEIAQRFALDPEVLASWERLFFAARGQRARTGWVHAHLTGPALQAGNADLAARLKLAAAGGPEAARAILDGDGRVALDQGQRLFDQRLKMQLKFHAACDMPLNSSRERLAFLRLHTELMSREKRLELEEKRLAQRCRQAREKQELARLRYQAAQDRQRQRSAARARREEARARLAAARNRAEQRRNRQRRAQWEAEREAAIARAASSPLAVLTWRDSRAAARRQRSAAAIAPAPRPREGAVAAPRLAFPRADSPSPAAIAVPA